MESVVGIFGSRSAAEAAVAELFNHGIPRESIIFLSAEAKPNVGPSETIQSNLDKVPTTDAEADGMGTAVGALWGGGVGASAGLAGGAALASLLVPGVGMIFAIGLGAAAVLGLGGAAIGAKAGEVAEHSLDIGVPRDDVTFYRELLKRGRSLVITNLEDEKTAETAKSIIEQRGGENVNEARKELRTAA
jgi:phage-related tail protein